MDSIFEKMKVMSQLLRVNHYIKNFLVLLPLFFDKDLFDYNKLLLGGTAFLSFSLTSSVVYILNDIQDVESDRNHPKKKYRPIASGAVGIKLAYGISVVILSIIIFLNYQMNFQGGGFLVLYLLLNVAYSWKLKQLPIVDVAILVSGFLIRLVYGANVTNVDLSFWIYMTVMSLAFYMGLGKRRNELQKNENNTGDVRKVLRFYTKEFLDKNMYVCLAVSIVFYSLWTHDAETIVRIGSEKQMLTVPLVMLMAMKYSLDIEKDEYADPVDIIVHDKWLMIMGIIYVLGMFAILYMR